LHQALELAAKPGEEANTDQFFALNEQLSHAPAGHRQQPLARPDGGRPAQGDEAQPPQLPAQRPGASTESLAEHQRPHGCTGTCGDAALAQQRMREHFANGLEAAE
jgi:hypothetical protein